MQSAMITDAVVVHFNFGFQRLSDKSGLLAKFRMLSRDAQLHQHLADSFGERRLNRSCRNAAPTPLLRQARNRQHRSDR